MPLVQSVLVLRSLLPRWCLSRTVAMRTACCLLSMLQMQLSQSQLVWLLLSCNALVWLEQCVGFVTSGKHCNQLNCWPGACRDLVITWFTFCTCSKLQESWFYDGSCSNAIHISFYQLMLWIKHCLSRVHAAFESISHFCRDLRIGRLRLNRIRIESGVTIRIESRIESAIYIPLNAFQRILNSVTNN